MNSLIERVKQKSFQGYYFYFTEPPRMCPNEAPHLSHSEVLWFDWFRDGILNADIDDTGKKPVLHYLVDLDVLRYDGKDLLMLSKIKEGQQSHEIKSVLLKDLNDISQTEKGFALVYFLSSFSITNLPPLRKEDSSSKTTRNNIFDKNYLPGKKKSSNLSNLQIVKKWGNQLRPFLDIEQKTIARLRGKHTCQEDAQWLFSYILNKTRQKSPAKKWEQLSRKRHR